MFQTILATTHGKTAEKETLVGVAARGHLPGTVLVEAKPERFHDP